MHAWRRAWARRGRTADVTEKPDNPAADMTGLTGLSSVAHGSEMMVPRVADMRFSLGKSLGKFRLKYRSPGPLAQLAEQRTFNPRVVGSIPTGPTE